MRGAVRIAVGVVGLATVVYGVVTWRPIEVHTTHVDEPDIKLTQHSIKATSAEIVVAGLALLAFAAWPRRSKPESPPAS